MTAARPSQAWPASEAPTGPDDELSPVLERIIHRFSAGATSPEQNAELAALSRSLSEGAPTEVIDRKFQAASRQGFLRGALTLLAARMLERPLPSLGLVLARELLDSVDIPLGLALARSIAGLPPLPRDRFDPHSAHCQAHLALGQALLTAGDPRQALRHLEVVIAADITHAGAQKSWRAAVGTLGETGPEGSKRASLAMASISGLDEAELTGAEGLERYDIGTPLGRGRHAVVYRAHDRRLGREVAIKRLLEGDSRDDVGVARAKLDQRFFAEALALSHVRSRHVISIYDAQPQHRFIAMELCLGGDLRQALRRARVGPQQLAQIAHDLRLALEAVHASGSLHRDVKPANLLLRDQRSGSPVVLADFGLALEHSGKEGATRAGTLRYLAPELRGDLLGPDPTRASDLFSAGAVLLEVFLAPSPLPPAFDSIAGDFDPRSLIPPELPQPWRDTIHRLLDPSPAARHW